MFGKENTDMRNQNYSPLKPTNQINGLLIIFQLRIYAGFILSIITLFTHESDYLGIIITILLYLPLVVCLILLYKKLIAFRVWYIVGTGLLICFSLVNGTTRIAAFIIELFIIIALYKSKYITDNFRKMDKKENLEDI